MNILVAESKGFSPRALEVLRTLGDVQMADLAGPALCDALGECEVLWVRLRNRIDARVMDAAPCLKFIVSATTGLNHIDLDAAERRGVRVISLKGEVDFLKEIRATAELTIGLMLALMRNIPSAARDVLDGHWDRDRYQGRELYGQDVGLVGFGRLGRIVAGYLLAFGSRVRVYDPAVPDPNMPGVESVALEDLLKTSRLVSLHASYSRENEQFFNADCFEHMPCGAWFVNTARGELVDESALLAALESGHLAGAAVDVLAAESALSLPTHPLVQFACSSDRLIVTPHIGGCTLESMERAEYFVVRKLESILAC